jgi:hypothetical protein
MEYLRDKILTGDNLPVEIPAENITGTVTADFIEDFEEAADALINDAPEKFIPVDNDYVGWMDSAASFVRKRLKWSSIKSTLKSYFDTLYAPKHNAIFTGSFKAETDSQIISFGDSLQNGTGAHLIINTLTGNVGLYGNVDLGNCVARRLQVENELGFYPGSRGIAGQVTSKSTEVFGVDGYPIGKITTHNAALAGQTTVSFYTENYIVEAEDICVATHHAGGTHGAYDVSAQCVAGGLKFAVRNITNGSLSEAITIKFILFKA